ncbi:kinase-like domain-containing protein [Amanita rubescens]|nr:kinase-like domain-containing protein [Amanita rubescens]
MEGYSMVSQDVGDDTFPLLLFTLSIRKSKSLLCPLTVNLMHKILSGENYINLAAQLDHDSDAENLLDFIPHWLHNYSLSNQDPAIVDMNRRARRFVLAVISRTHDVPLCNIPHDPVGYTLPLLLTILKNKPEPPVTSIANGMTIGLVSEILFREDYITLASQVNQLSDAINLLKFIMHMFGCYSLSNRDPAMKQRAGQFMSAVISKMRGEPPSNMPYDFYCSMLESLLYILNSREKRIGGLKRRGTRFILEVIAGIQGLPSSNSNIPDDSNTFHLIISILGDAKKRSSHISPHVIDEVLPALMYDILSLEDCADFVAQLDHTTPADATNLLDFVLDSDHIMFFEDFEDADANQRARLFVLKIMSKTYIEPPPNLDDLEDYAFPLFLYILCYHSPWVVVNDIVHPLVTDLWYHILSREDYINTVAQLDRASDAENLLDFLLAMLEYDLILNQHSSTLRPSIAIVYTPGSRYGGAIIVDLMCEILSREDYVNLVTRIDDPLDASKLLDFILDLLNHRASIQDATTADITRRARRFILKVISRMPIVPPSLIVTGVTIPSERDYIGGGGFGRVFKGKRRGKAVALKVLYKCDNQVAFCREALMWRSLKHKFVLPFLGIHEITNTTEPQFFLVSPYMKNGTLARWRKQANPPIAVIEERSRKPWNTSTQKAHFMEIFAGYSTSDALCYDADSLLQENVLLDDNFHVQIADFGLTRLSEATNTRSGALHLNFAAPELFGISGDDDDPSDDPSPRTQMSDVYAFGCLFYEIYYDSIPFAGKTDLQILTLVSRGVLPPRLDEQPLSDGAWNVIRRCWVREPLSRPRMNNVVESMIAMSQFVSPQINADDESLREELPPSSTPDSKEPDNPIALTSATNNNPTSPIKNEDVT